MPLRRLAPFIAFLVALLLVRLAAPAEAQRTDTLAVAPGSRLRIATQAASAPFSASLVEQMAGGIVVGDCRACGADSTIRWSDLRAVEVRNGRRHGGRSALVGAGIGVLAGTLIAAVAVHQDTQSCKSTHEDFCGLAVLAIPAVALTGGAVGLLAGLVIGTERWERVWPAAPRR